MFDRRTALAAPLLTAGAALLPVAAQAAAPARTSWRAAWGRALVTRTDPPTFPAGSTYVETVRSSLPGQAFRIRLDNGLGAKPLYIASASARWADGTVRAIAFDGSARGLAAVDAALVSDPVRHPLAPGEPVEISVTFERPALASAFARSAAPTGAALILPSGERQPIAPHFLGRLDVAGGRAAPVVIVLSDTKSAGDEAWPTALARLAAGRLGVVNRSVWGGHLALGPAGASALARFDRDVLSTPGATDVLVYAGNNDLIQPGMMSNGRMSLDPADALEVPQICALLAQCARRARDAGLRAIGGTWLAYEGVTIAEGYSTPEKMAKRVEINRWIRTTDAFDAVIDFDRILADPARPARLDPRFDSGNHFTPNAAGYDAMAQVALPVLTRAGPAR